MLAIGSDLDGVQTQNFAQPQPRHADRDRRSSAPTNYRVDVYVAADAASVAAALAGAVRAAARRRPRRPRRGARRGVRRARRDRAALPGRDPLRRPRRRRPRRRHVHPGLLAGRVPHARRARAGCRSRSAGARSATRSRPRSARRCGRRPDVAISGDGGFLYACGELATMAQEQIPLTLSSTMTTVSGISSCAIVASSPQANRKPPSPQIETAGRCRPARRRARPGTRSRASPSRAGPAGGAGRRACRSRPSSSPGCTCRRRGCRRRARRSGSRRGSAARWRRGRRTPRRGPRRGPARAVARARRLRRARPRPRRVGGDVTSTR